MQNEMSRLQRLGEVMTQHGTQMVLALVVLIVGLLLARVINKGLRKALPPSNVSSMICNCVYIILVTMVVTAAAVEFGAKPINMLRLLTIIALVASGLFIFLKPFIPSMPFKVGNTVKKTWFASRSCRIHRSTGNRITLHQTQWRALVTKPLNVAKTATSPTDDPSRARKIQATR